jgi:hypothetical protein
MITIGFSKSKKKFPIFSWLIRLFEKVDFSHVYLKITTRYGDIVYQASGTSVNITSYNIFLKNNTVVAEFKFNVTEERSDELYTMCVSYLGIKYGTKQILRIALYRLLRKLNITPRNYRSDDVKTMICSEVVARVLPYLTEVSFQNIDQVGVADIYNYLINNHAE